ncbi:MAG: ROK family protein [Candidatus Onthomorpha sp.]|nr:ROK family protein [Candidatus Onthomorpha sp.]
MNYTIGIDLGGTNTRIGLVEEDGKIVEVIKFKTYDHKKLNDFVETLSEAIVSIAQKYNLPKECIKAGIGAPNGNYYNGTIEQAPNLPFKGIVPLVDLLKESLKTKSYSAKVVLTNDANAAAMGEKIYGKAKNVRDFVMITLGTGVGSGIFVDNKLVYGKSGFAGEAGHAIVQPEGRACGCGRHGCLETYCSATGIVRTAKELLKNESTPSLLRAINQDMITAKDISEAADKNDAMALECFDITARYLALGLANVAVITSPEAIFISGGLSKAGEKLFKPLREYFEQFLYPVFRNTISIEPSALEDNEVAILGAASLVF